MQYPLPEKIGDPDLFVGREKEFRNFGKWLAKRCASACRFSALMASRWRLTCWRNPVAGGVVLAEVKKRQAKTGLAAVEDFQEKVDVYAQQFPDKIILPAFLSLGSFTVEARQFCAARDIGTAQKIAYALMRNETDL